MSWYCEPVSSVDETEENIMIMRVYNKIFADRIHDDQHGDRHFYNQLIPNYYNEDGKKHLIRESQMYFDNCVRIASMDRDKFVDAVCECFENEKKQFDNWRNREIIDLLDALPDKTIRGYLDMKGS